MAAICHIYWLYFQIIKNCMRHSLKLAQFIRWKGFHFQGIKTEVLCSTSQILLHIFEPNALFMYKQLSNTYAVIP